MNVIIKLPTFACARTNKTLLKTRILQVWTEQSERRRRNKQPAFLVFQMRISPELEKIDWFDYRM